MLNLDRIVSKGMHKKLEHTTPSDMFKDSHSIQYQLDVMRKAILNQPNALAELKRIEEARYGHSTS